jgi:hypothetical protein
MVCFFFPSSSATASMAPGDKKFASHVERHLVKWNVTIDPAGHMVNARHVRATAKSAPLPYPMRRAVGYRRLIVSRSHSRSELHEDPPTVCRSPLQRPHFPLVGCYFTRAPTSTSALAAAA